MRDGLAELSFPMGKVALVPEFAALGSVELVAKAGLDGRGGRAVGGGGSGDWRSHRRSVG